MGNQPGIKYQKDSVKIAKTLKQHHHALVEETKQFRLKLNRFKVRGRITLRSHLLMKKENASNYSSNPLFFPSI